MGRIQLLQSEKGFLKNYTFPHLETLRLWRSRHRCSTPMFCSTKQSHLSAVQSCVPIPEWIPAGPLLPGAGCLQSLPHHAETFQKSSGCNSSEWWWWWIHSHQPAPSCSDLARRAPQKSLQKPFHQHPDFAVHYAMQSVEHWQQETPPPFRLHTSFTSPFV